MLGSKYKEELLGWIADEQTVLQELINRHEEQKYNIIELQELNNRLEKALDKVCGDYANLCNQLRQNASGEELKQYYLKGSEKK